mmetsp:Transcript_72123/g.181824  ORF Transcript_72123/g.181824 Transcript_72123/m.181824 type:complete len:154 (-) Transcript_72123:273-734(-)
MVAMSLSAASLECQSMEDRTWFCGASDASTAALPAAEEHSPSTRESTSESEEEVLATTAVDFAGKADLSAAPVGLSTGDFVALGLLLMTVVVAVSVYLCLPAMVGTTLASIFASVILASSLLPGASLALSVPVLLAFHAGGVAVCLAVQAPVL